MENFFATIADRWPADRADYHWHVLPGTELMRDHVARPYAELLDRPGLAPVRPEYLHITVQHLGPASDLPAGELETARSPADRPVAGHDRRDQGCSRSGAADRSGGLSPAPDTRLRHRVRRLRADAGVAVGLRSDRDTRAGDPAGPRDPTSRRPRDHVPRPRGSPADRGTAMTTTHHAATSRQVQTSRRSDATPWTHAGC
jgi:hypothetical protein